MKTFACLLGLAVIFVLFSTGAVRAADPVIVHEWGTFTCLQDEQGYSIGGINVDDEQVPDFVYQTAVGVASQYDSLQGWHNLGLPPYQRGKGWLSGDPSVTMRLETPVLYIYPPQGQSPQSVPPLDVHVDFHGGVLSQYYPYAKFSGLPFLRFPGQPQDNIFPHIDKATGITGQTTTSLDWEGVQLGSTEKPIEADDKVWTTPREVSAPVLQIKYTPPADKGVVQTYTQAEHFLFYRGVGHLDSPLKLDDWVRGKVGTTTHLCVLRRNIDENEIYPEAWLVEIHPDGTAAFQTVSSFGEPYRGAATGVHPLATINLTSSASFKSTDFSVDNLTKLKASMQASLVKEGLYPDEASAMLRTWELSYFKSPGLRFFYVVPRGWVDKVLPLKITGAPAQITRVMIGRIELITDAQREALARLAKGPCPNLPAFKRGAQVALQNSKLSKDEVEAFYRGEKPLSELGIPIPSLVQDYLSMGRFRDALVMREQQQHPSVALAQFIKDNNLAPQTN